MYIRKAYAGAPGTGKTRFLLTDAWEALKSSQNSQALVLTQSQLEADTMSRAFIALAGKAMNARIDYLPMDKLLGQLVLEQSSKGLLYLPRLPCSTMDEALWAPLQNTPADRLFIRYDIVIIDDLHYIPVPILNWLLNQLQSTRMLSVSVCATSFPAYADSLCTFALMPLCQSFRASPLITRYMQTIYPSVPVLPRRSTGISGAVSYTTCATLDEGISVLLNSASQAGTLTLAPKLTTLYELEHGLILANCHYQARHSMFHSREALFLSSAIALLYQGDQTDLRRCFEALRLTYGQYAALARTSRIPTDFMRFALSDTPLEALQGSVESSVYREVALIFRHCWQVTDGNEGDVLDLLARGMKSDLGFSPETVDILHRWLSQFTDATDMVAEFHRYALRITQQRKHCSHLHLWTEASLPEHDVVVAYLDPNDLDHLRPRIYSALGLARNAVIFVVPIDAELIINQLNAFDIPELNTCEVRHAS